MNSNGTVKIYNRHKEKKMLEVYNFHRRHSICHSVFEEQALTYSWGDDGVLAIQFLLLNSCVCVCLILSSSWQLQNCLLCAPGDVYQCLSGLSFLDKAAEPALQLKVSTVKYICMLLLILVGRSLSYLFLLGMNYINTFGKFLSS